MVLNNVNIFSRFIGFHSDVTLVRNIHVDDKDASKFDINKSSVAFKLKNDKDIFVLTPFLDDGIDAANIVRITDAKNHLLTDDGDWIDNFTVTAVDWVGIADDLTTTPDKLHSFLNDIAKFFDGDDDFVDVNRVDHNINVDFGTLALD